VSEATQRASGGGWACAQWPGVALLRQAIRHDHAGRIAVVSSFGAESALLLAIVAEIDPAVPVLFLDTLKHFPETLAYRARLTERLGLRDVRVIRPDPGALAKADPDGELHRYVPDDCCNIRKVAPLERALAPFAAWVSGRKRYQGATRAALPFIESVDGKTKYNPLADIGAADIAAEIRRRRLPEHGLLAQGYASIGCAPCTRPVAVGADPRSGRWAHAAKVECGIHRPAAASPAAPPPLAAQAVPPSMDQPMTDLDHLESQSIFILREAYQRLRPLALLWSLGKDSNVMVWLARKAFLGRVPFPVLHVDTGRKFPEMYAFRARYAAEWGLDLRIGTCPPLEESDPTLPPAARSAARKTAGLASMIEQLGLAGVIAGIRRDEQATRAKERVFSPRGAGHRWDVRNQPAEFWDQFAAPTEPGAHVRVHPLLAWREVDIWRYIAREGIPVVDLYFARNGQRYRSLGDADITSPIASTAATTEEIIAELHKTRQPERAGRAMDHESEDAFERLRVAGYL
jgi:sulfate adenylyltransferase subunit 2